MSGGGGAARHSVKVTLGGIELSISSEHPPEYTREVAGYFDAVLGRIKNGGPTLDAHRAALLAGLAITDELFQARAAKGSGGGTGAPADLARIRAMRDRLARLIPVPAKPGGGRAKGA